jgi:hypothetical protein
MMPWVREENLPTSHPKKTGTPALIIFTTVDFMFSISVLTSRGSFGDNLEKANRNLTQNRTSTEDVSESIDSVQLRIVVARVVDEREGVDRRVWLGYKGLEEFFGCSFPVTWFAVRIIIIPGEFLRRYTEGGGHDSVDLLQELRTVILDIGSQRIVCTYVLFLET